MADRMHRFLGAAAALILLVGIWGWKSLGPKKGVAAMAPTSVPNPNVAQLAEFTSPLSDTLRTIPVVRDSIVLRRDPFAGQPVPRATDDKVATVAAAPEREKNADAWHVTTTLMAGSRRAALINDALIYVGDRLPDGSRLTTVERDHVVVTDKLGAAHTVAVAKEGNG